MSDQNVCILDYGSGNVRSVFNVLNTLSDNVQISNDPKVIKAATHIILPGVGAFGASMKKINDKIPVKILEEEVLKKKKPFLGICVGMQVLATTGFEFGEFKGLGWIPGKVVKIESGELPLPHIGWNDVDFKKASALSERFDQHPDFYFVHSFILKPDDKSVIVGTCTYGEEFCAVINKDNIFGVQFHPEKSQKAGKILLENFLNYQK